MALIKCENVSFSYENTSVIKNLNFEVNQGDYLCIVGENGSGKSTLIKGILGLKSAADGKISRGDGLKANETGYLPQQTPAQKDFPASVYEVVLSGRLNSRGLKPLIYRAVNSREFYWQELCVQAKKFFCLMNPSRDLTPSSPKICTNSLMNSTKKKALLL